MGTNYGVFEKLMPATVFQNAKVRMTGTGCQRIIMNGAHKIMLVFEDQTVYHLPWEDVEKMALALKENMNLIKNEEKETPKRRRKLLDEE